MNLPNVVARYAQRYAAVHRIGHSVSSPLGAWLALAVAAQAAPEGELRDEVEAVLGIEAPAAASALENLLRDPPGVVSAAVAAWGFGGADWVRHLPDAVQTGPMPTQSQADAWTRKHTLGMIEKFPSGDIRALDQLLASLLATRVSWVDAYELTDARELRSPWCTQVTEVLEGACDELGGYLAHTAGAGTVGVHTAHGVLDADRSGRSLSVTSVIAEDNVDPVDVLAAAHGIAIAEATGAEVSRISLHDVPLGDGAFWTITEEPAIERGEPVRAILPAWTAESTHDLMTDPELGFGVVPRVMLSAGGGSPARPVNAFQAAVAGYGQYGFEAAAFTGIALGCAFGSPEPARVATLRFGHPYAVVAVMRHARTGDPWHGIPLFAAWVAEPRDPSEVSIGS